MALYVENTLEILNIPTASADPLEQMLIGLDLVKFTLEARDATDREYSFQSAWRPPLLDLYLVSDAFPGVTFLLTYYAAMVGFRGQAVLRNGEVLEQCHRVFGAAGAEAFDLSHPLPDLFSHYRRRVTPTPSLIQHPENLSHESETGSGSEHLAVLSRVVERQGIPLPS